MKKALLFISIIILNISGFAQNNELESQNDYVVFTLEKTECKGTCPVYIMEIYKSGKVIYEGRKHTDKIGKYKKNIDISLVEELIKEFQKANFFGFENEYTGDITCMPTTYISFTQEKETKKIRDYYNAPKELTELEIKLEKIAESEGWEKF